MEKVKTITHATIVTSKSAHTFDIGEELTHQALDDLEGDGYSYVVVDSERMSIAQAHAAVEGDE